MFSRVIKNGTKKDGLVQWLSFFVPMVFPAIFFESGILLLLSPLALLILTLKSRVWVTGIALVTNLALLYSISRSPENLMGALALWLLVGALLPAFIIKTGNVLKSAAWVYGLGALIILGFSLYASQKAGTNIIEYYRAQIESSLQLLSQTPNNPLKKVIEDQGFGTVTKQILGELPSAVMISMIVTLWLNLLFASRLMPGFLSKQFWGKFKLPEWLVWPTLGFAALFIFGQHAIQTVGLNGLKFFLALYALQGLSIISFLLNKFRVGGLFRALVVVTIILMGIPLVVGFGFFDQWFDFRKKFGQSLKP